MAKVKRSVLKEIVKECLLEILFEGIDSESGLYEEDEPIREARRPNRRASRPSPKNDLHAAVKQKTQKPSKALQENFVTSAVSELTTDPMMAGIFADTAQTTLRDQKERRRPPADNAAAAVENVDNVGDLFEGAGNWASIAFGETE